MPAGKKIQLEFYETFGLSGTAAVTSKTIAAPIERIKMVRPKECIAQEKERNLERGEKEKEKTKLKWISHRVVLTAT